MDSGCSFLLSVFLRQKRFQLATIKYTVSLQVHLHKRQIWKSIFLLSLFQKRRKSVIFLMLFPTYWSTREATREAAREAARYPNLSDTWPLSFRPTVFLACRTASSCRSASLKRPTHYEATGCQFIFCSLFFMWPILHLSKQGSHSAGQDENINLKVWISKFVRCFLAFKGSTKIPFRIRRIVVAMTKRLNLSARLGQPTQRPN